MGVVPIWKALLAKRNPENVLAVNRARRGRKVA
jgi:hypothetical protein